MRRGPPTVSASFAARPSITKTPTHEPPWSWKPVSRASHQVLSQASLCSLRQSSSNEPEPVAGERRRVDARGRGAGELGALLGAEGAACVGDIGVARRHRGTIPRGYARSRERSVVDRVTCTAATTCGSSRGMPTRARRGQASTLGLTRGKALTRVGQALRVECEGCCCAGTRPRRRPARRRSPPTRPLDERGRPAAAALGGGRCRAAAR